MGNPGFVDMTPSLVDIAALCARHMGIRIPRCSDPGCGFKVYKVGPPNVIIWFIRPFYHSRYIYHHW